MSLADVELPPPFLVLRRALLLWLRLPLFLNGGPQAEASYGEYVGEHT